MPSIRGRGRSRSSERHINKKKIFSTDTNFEEEGSNLGLVYRGTKQVNEQYNIDGEAVINCLSSFKSSGESCDSNVVSRRESNAIPISKSGGSLAHPRQNGLVKTISVPLSPLPSEKKLKPQLFHNDIKKANEQDLMCPICLEVLYRPRELVCGHRFCLTCLQSYSNSCWNRFSCPSCRHNIELPANGVLGLPRNWRLENAAGQFNERKNLLTNRDQICVHCHSDEDIIGCDHCGKGWCYVCRPSHLNEIKKEFHKLRANLKETKETLLCRQEEQEIRFKKLEQRIYEAIEHKKDELTSQVNNMREKCQNKVSRLFDEIEDALTSPANLPNIQLSFEEAGKQHSEVNLLFTEVLASIEPRVTFNCASLTISTFDANGKNVESFINKQSKGDEDEKRREHDKEDHFILPKDKSALYRRKSSHSKHRWGHNICGRPAGIAVAPTTGHLYVTASDSCKVYIYDQSGKQISSFGCRGHKDGHFLCPTGIAFSQIENELYITDKWKHCIHVFDPEGRFLRTVGRKGKGFGQFSSPEGITTDSHGNIYVADTCNDRVQILDSDGVYLCEVGVVSSEILGHGRRYTKREFSEPVGVAVSSDGKRIYVADSGNHRIRVFNGQTGERLMMFGSRGYNKGQFESPECIAIDNEGFIIVGDSGNGRVQVFRPNGHFVRALGTKNNKKGEFGWVSGIALTKNNEILVTDFKNNTIAVF